MNIDTVFTAVIELVNVERPLYETWLRTPSSVLLENDIYYVSIDYNRTLI